MPERIVERKPRPGNRVLIRLSGGRFFAVPEEAAAALAVGVDLADDEIARLSNVDQYLRGRDKVGRMLALRARSRREVDDALRTLGIADAIRSGILAEYEDMGLVDDARFARDFVTVKKDSKRLGPHRLRGDLARLGVNRDAAEEALGAYGPDEQEALARSLAERALQNGRVDEKAVRRVAGMLSRKGFDYAVVNRVAYDLSRRMTRGEEPAEMPPADDL